MEINDLVKIINNTGFTWFAFLMKKNGHVITNYYRNQMGSVICIYKDKGTFSISHGWDCREIYTYPLTRIIGVRDAKTAYLLQISFPDSSEPYCDIALT